MLKISTKTINLFWQLRVNGIAMFKLITFFILTFVLVPLYLIAKFGKNIIPNSFDFQIRALWSRSGLWLCNIHTEIHGSVSHFPDAYACNHVSWLDILVLQSILNISFVAKSEVKHWPFFGFLAKIADTIFIDRRVLAAKSQQGDLIKAMRTGKVICFFPEGTSTDGSYVLPFKSSLFEVFTSQEIEDSSRVMVQPIALVYSREDNARSTTLGWWGDMNLISHIFDIVATVKSGKVKVFFEEPIDAKKIGDRKKLALAAELVVKKRFAD